LIGMSSSSSSSSPLLLPPSAVLSLWPSRPPLATPADALIFALHAALKSLGCRCVATSEEHAEQIASSSSHQDTKEEHKDLPSSWNQSSDLYTLVYRHPSLPGLFIMKGIRMDDTLLIHATIKNSDKVHTLELSIKDIIAADQLGSGDPQRIFKSLSSLLTLFDSAIVSKVCFPPPPSQSAEHMPLVDRLPRRPDPDFDYPPRQDPLRMPTRPSPGAFPRRGDFDDDLNPFPSPLGPAPSFGGPPIGGIPAGMGPRGLDPFGGGSGGLMGPNHPIFGARGRGRGGMDPRFDPIGPFNIYGPNPDHDKPPGPPPDDFYT